MSSLSMKKKLGKKEYVPKQGRKKVKPRPTLDDSTFDDLDVDLAHGMDYMDTEEVVDEGRTSSKTEELNVTNDTMIGEKGGSTKYPVSTVVAEVSTVNISTASRPEVSTATPMTPPTTTSVFEDEDIFLANSLVMLSDKTKLKGVAIKEVEESNRLARSVLTLKPLLTIDPKDKGKGVLEDLEPAKKMTKSDFDAAQVARDEEVARQAEREQFTIEQRAKFLHDTIAAQRKFLAEQRAVAIRSKPLTKTQLRNQMITFLKYVGRYTHSKLRNKKFEEVQVLYEKAKKSIQYFVPIGSAEDERLIEKNEKRQLVKILEIKEKVLEEPDSTKMEVKQEEVEESTRKRPGTILKMKARKKARKQTHADSDASKKKKGSPRMKRMSKRKKTDSDLEEEEHLLYDEVQARIDADHELAVRWSHEEQEKYTVDERAKILAEYFKRKKKQLAEERVAAIRNKPPTKTQLRSLMMTYFKNIGRFTHSQLNKRSFEDIQALYLRKIQMMIFGRIKRNGFLRVSISMKTVEFIP
ncbi:hypothetical protein Tco_1356213 [Tanacetum coccineum]